MAQFTIPVPAVGTLTLSGQPLNTETVVVGQKTYTFQTSLTDVDGNVKIGASAEGSIDNLVAAINLATGAGTNYAASMTLNPSVRAAKTSATTMKVYAKVAGLVGNLIPSTETLTNGSWGGAVLASGTGDAGYALGRIVAEDQVSAGVRQALAEVLGSEVS